MFSRIEGKLIEDSRFSYGKDIAWICRACLESRITHLLSKRLLLCYAPNASSPSGASSKIKYSTDEKKAVRAFVQKKS